MSVNSSFQADSTVMTQSRHSLTGGYDAWILDLPALPHKPWYVRWSARMVAYTIVAVSELLIRIFGKAHRRAHGQPISDKAKHVMLTGTFHSDGWLEAHVRPIAAASCCEHVTIVADSPMVSMPKVTYTCPPRWLQRTVGRVPSRSLWYVLTAFRQRPDVCGGFHLLCNGLLAILVARLSGVRSLYFSVGGRTEIIAGGAFGENKVFGSIGRYDNTLEASLLRLVNQCDLIVTMGSGGRRFLRERGITVPVHVIPGGISDNMFRLTADVNDKRYDVIVVCRLVPIKRLDVFLKAISIARQTLPAIKAVIVGDGEQRLWLRKLSSSLQLEDNVEFVGHQTAISSWLSNACVFMLTSDSEGLALSVMEAMAAGLPCVVSSVGDLADLVQDGKNGFLVPRRKPEVFAEKLLDLLVDRDKLVTFANEARRGASCVGTARTAAKWAALLANQGPAGTELTP